jgi:hypothetical protein
MLAWELVVEAQALRSQGWTVSAIARHLGVDIPQNRGGMHYEE